MENRNNRTRVVFSSILGIALAFQLCAAPAALGQYYNDGATHDVSEASYHSAWIDGEGTIVNFNAAITGGVHVCWFLPGATLNYGAGAQALYIDAGSGSYVNLYGGSVSWVMFVASDAQVTIYGEKFEVGGTQYDPGTTLNIAYAMVTAYDAAGLPLFTGRISCAVGATVSLDSEAKDLDVQIDVKPGSDPTVINLSSNGLVPVAVLSDETFDATQVQPETVQFAGASVAVSEKGKYMAHVTDVDEDGDDDMLFHFRINDLELEDGVTEAEVTLTGQLGSSQVQVAAAKSLPSAGQINDGTPISGTDNVQILQPKKKK